MRERIAIVDGRRTPFCKAGGSLKDMEADDLGAESIKGLLAATDFAPDLVDEVIFGNVLQPPHATNIARVLSVKGGLPVTVPAFTVDRNCASGMEAVVTAANKILLGDTSVMIAGGTESMSNFPVLVNKPFKELLLALSKAKTWQQKLKIFLLFRPSMIVPEFPQVSDPLCGLTMGQTAEVISRQFKIDREEQDRFAKRSHDRASRADADGRFDQEIVPVALPPKYDQIRTTDEGPRSNQTLEALAKLKAVFEPHTGTVTAGNSSPLTDGAVALLLMSESKAKSLGIKPLGYLTAYAFAALEPRRMGLGPVFATSKLLQKTGRQLKDFDLIEINEAFAAQVLSCERAFASKEFAQKELGRSDAIGEIDPEKLNVNGGAIALGHPLGASGARIILTLLKELRLKNKKLGLATLCIGGGQGEAAILEVE